MLRQRELQSGVQQGRGFAIAGTADHHEPRQLIQKAFSLEDFTPARHIHPQLPQLPDGLRDNMVDGAQVGFDLACHRYLFPARMQEATQQLFIHTQRTPQPVQAVQRVHQQDETNQGQADPQRRKRMDIAQGQQRCDEANRQAQDTDADDTHRPVDQPQYQQHQQQGNGHYPATHGGQRAQGIK